MKTEAEQGRPFSLRLRLVMLAALVMMVSLGLVGLALDRAFHKSSEAGLRARMESLVYLVLGATEATGKGRLVVADDFADPHLVQPGSGVYAHLHGDQDEWTSASALGISLPELPLFEAGRSSFKAPTAETGFYTFRYGVSWELPDGRLLPVTVSILVDPRELHEEIQAFRGGLWRSLGAAGVILVAAQLVLLALGLRPLRRISQDIAGIESGRLERLVDSYPRELEPLTRNINHLLDTEKANQTRYRNALDSLAHSLKTPLSVIRSSLPADTAAKAAAVEHAAVDMQHLIATRLQRAAASTRRTMAQAVDVNAQARRLVQSLSRVYSQGLINVDVTIEDGLGFYGEERDLLELMGNLLDNACKYGNGRVQLSARALEPGQSRAGIHVEVDDNGPGIPPDRREQLLQRGVRGDERVEGHGLGLAIVLEIVSAYDGEINIGDSSLGGASVRVSLMTAPGRNHAGTA